MGEPGSPAKESAMKKILIPLLVIVLVAAASLPPASADGGHNWRGRGGRVERHEYRGGGCVGCALFGGLVLGGIIGGLLAAPHYAAPAPVYAPPPPTCYTQSGYWTQVPYVSSPEYTTYRNVWVPPQTVCQ